MKSLKAVSLFLCLIMCISFAGCVNNFTDTITPPPGYFDSTPLPKATMPPSNITPVLYKVSDNEGSHIWLFSSISCDQDKFYPLPSYVVNAFDNSEYMAIEYDRIALSTSAEGQLIALSHMIYKDDITIKDCISHATYEEAVKIISENAIYNDRYDEYIAAYWANMIDGFTFSKIGDDTQDSVERYLTLEAKNKKKRIVEMEAFDFNHQMMAGFSNELQEAILKDSIVNYKNPNNLTVDNNSLITAWTTGDIDKLREASNEISDLDWNQEICDEYIEKKYTQRNDIIINKIENALSLGEEAFFCVIYTNVFSEGGIVQVLSEKGYTVEAIKN